MNNIIYCGMAGDIMSPLLLVPDFDTLFVIDLFDPCFSSEGSWKSQKDDIRRILLDGSDENSWSRALYNRQEKPSIHYLAGKSEIIDENETILDKKEDIDDIKMI